MNVRKIDTNEFRKRKLERSYISVYIVIKSIAVETENIVEPKNLCVIYGFTALGARKIIALYFENTEDNRFWLNIFEDGLYILRNMYSNILDIKEVCPILI